MCFQEIVNESETEKEKSDVDGPVAKSLTPLVKKLCTVLKRTIVKEKREDTVVLIFNQQMIKYIDCLIEHRAELVDRETCTYLPVTSPY